MPGTLQIGVTDGDGIHGEPPPVLTDRQDRLLRLGRILAWANMAVGFVGLVFWLTDLDAATWVALGLVLAGCVGVILILRSLTKSGPPFERARWWWPWDRGSRSAHRP